MSNVPTASRRDLLTILAACPVLLACRPSAARAAVVMRHAPVVGFHNDAPWLDPSGRALPYLPPTARDQPWVDRESLVRLGHFL